jgi:exopolysaccharide production protein ExoY
LTFLVDECFTRCSNLLLSTGEAVIIDDQRSVPSLRTQPLARPVGGAAKRAFDLIVSALLIGFLAPLMLCVALAVRHSGAGKAIYRHERIGLDGKPFACLKFRTMVVDADSKLAQLLERDPKARAEWQACHKLSQDPRITPIGRLLRVSSLDELPQLFNVFRGEMSLVGPRPVTLQEVSFYGSAASLYLSARPGITGLWQVSGRSDTSFARRVGFDVDYVKKWSFARDILILVRTIFVVIRRQGSR